MSEQGDLPREGGKGDSSAPVTEDCVSCWAKGYAEGLRAGRQRLVEVAVLDEVKTAIEAETTATDREFDTGYRVVCRLLLEEYGQAKEG